MWLKRDIRSQDHEALFHAEQSTVPYIIIYVFEPTIIQYPDTSPRHLKFIYHSLKSLTKALKPFNRRVEIMYAEALEVFKYLNTEFEVKNVFSYQESGIQLTWKRDKEVGLFFKKNKIHWQEFQRDGVLRGIKNRDNWNKQWRSKMHAPVIKNNYSLSELEALSHSFLLPEKLEAELKEYCLLYTSDAADE